MRCYETEGQEEGEEKSRVHDWTGQGKIGLL